MVDSVDATRAEARFSAELPAVPAARHFVGDVLASWGVADGLAWSAAFVVAELASNAVLHACTPFAVALVRDGDRLRVEVSDGSPRRPRPRHYGADAATGRGLTLVATFSTEWGTIASPTGKTVWSELADPASLDDTSIPEPDLDAFSDPFDTPPPRNRAPGAGLLEGGPR